MKKLSLFFISLFATTAFADTPAVRQPVAARGGSVIQSGTTVRARVAPVGLYTPECYEAYYGCMDQFCMSEVESGGTCLCDDQNAAFEQRMADIQKQLNEANNLKTVEVEKVRSGAQADIIFTGTREYDKSGNVIDVNAPKPTARGANLLSLWDEAETFDPFAATFDDDISGKSGAELRDAAHNMCASFAGQTCNSTELNLLTNLYSAQVKADCKAYDNAIVKLQQSADTELAKAQAEVRQALRDSFEAANEFDRGTCMVNFKKCMQTDDACGSDWTHCVSSIGAENMQNLKAKSVAGKKIAHVPEYQITDITMELLESKRHICESVLDKCVAVRDMVWPDFLREAAYDIKLAELNSESKQRQSCLTDISDCIQNACRDDIAGKGIDSMDGCLSRPEMARSFCKVQIDRCERMEPLIFGYVKDKLAAMRVDRCTEEVKECVMSEDRCGADFGRCIGMDFDYIHDMCPVDKLVVCKANNPNFSMDDLDSMLMGFYLNADNAALEHCQNVVDAKMLEVCGAVGDCNKFLGDDLLGASSLRSIKDSDIYRITGMISFGSLKIGDSSGRLTDEDTKLGPGEIGTTEYIEEMKEKNSGVKNAEGIFASIEEELSTVAGVINRTIEMIEKDQEIQYCISGRDLSQITGKAGARTEARFPHLLDSVKIQIAIAAVRRAQENFNREFNAMLEKASSDASLDVAQYMCQKIAETGSRSITAGGSDGDTTLTPPYSVQYVVGQGLTNDELMQGGSGVIKPEGITYSNTGYLGGGDVQLDAGMMKTTKAIFDRTSRICNICTTTVTKDCKTTGSKGWFWNSKGVDCDTSDPVEKCEEIPM